MAEEIEDFEVKYVFGVEPLQQYMVEFDRPADMPKNEIARLQVLSICWDTKKKEWFQLQPPDVKEKIEPGDPLHWTGRTQCWNTSCADCHSTDLKKNFDLDSLTYHTTFSEIDVSCEACHGPGSHHVMMAESNSFFWDRKQGYGLAKLKGEDSTNQIETCAKEFLPVDQVAKEVISPTYWDTSPLAFHFKHAYNGFPNNPQWAEGAAVWMSRSAQNDS